MLVLIVTTAASGDNTRVSGSLLRCAHVRREEKRLTALQLITSPIPCSILLLFQPGPSERKTGKGGGRKPEAHSRRRDQKVDQREKRAVPSGRNSRKRAVLFCSGAVSGERHVPDLTRPVPGYFHGEYGSRGEGFLSVQEVWGHDRAK